MTARLGGAPAWPSRAPPPQSVPPSSPPPAFDPRSVSTTQHLNPQSLPPRTPAQSYASVAPPAHPQAPLVQAAPVRTRGSKVFLLVVVAAIALIVVSVLAAAIAGRRARATSGSG